MFTTAGPYRSTMVGKSTAGAASLAWATRLSFAGGAAVLAAIAVGGGHGTPASMTDIAVARSRERTSVWRSTVHLQDGCDAGGPAREANKHGCSKLLHSDADCGRRGGP
ncbi:protein of unknown function [Burkholderia multivorans]